MEQIVLIVLLSLLAVAGIAAPIIVVTRIMMNRRNRDTNTIGTSNARSSSRR
jgi:hypothetical protein